MITSWGMVWEVVSTLIIYGGVFTVFLILWAAIISSMVDQSIKTFYRTRREQALLSHRMMQEIAKQETVEGNTEHANT